ncbi:hypothetical protein H9P43_004666 [Blastocladiella emersonii ATCC 22665]|nr:hypothetical protein H9P43_004666 [Blastocladiella emersonii ATCC 22665]
MLAHNVVEPTVIDEDLLSKCVNEQASGDAAEIARKEGIDFHEVTSLRLDYKNILKIENLWQFDSLTKLQLDNNIIERIEGISHLRNLRWLDLSFNNITVIEGLDSLTKLTDLSLLNNRITKLENMDKLVRLNVLSIGNNDIQDMAELAYLSRFENLRLLNVSGNPLCRNPEYRSFVLSRLRHLKYLDYRLIEGKAVAAAREKYIDDMIAIEEEQKIVAKQEAEALRRREEDERFAAAFLPGIQSLFETLIGTDQDYQRLLMLGREVLVDLQHQYRDKFDAVVRDLVANVIAQHEARADEVAEYAECLEDTMATSDAQGRRLLDEFMHVKKLLLRDVMAGAPVATSITSAADPAVPLGPPAEELRTRITQLSDDLLTAELVLVEQFEDLAKEFERNYLDMCNAVKETATAAFARLRELENEHHEKVTETVLAAFERQAKGDMEDVDDALRDLLRDKDAVNNHLTTSHDYHLSKIDAQEEAFSSGLAKSTDAIVGKVHQYEIDRNRDRLREIVMFTERCHQEIELAEENAA